VLILLPPSETKRDGGPEGTRLDLAALSYPELTAARRSVLSATGKLARNLKGAAQVLKLGPKQSTEVLRNRVLTSSPVMPAMDRYDGVLFDALKAQHFDARARVFAGEHLAIASALFGLVGALDPIPAYRLSHDSRLPGLQLKKVWREPISGVLAARPGLVLDLRSEGYAALGPIPNRADAVYVRVVSEGADGRRQALNHFNKAGKGELARKLVLAGTDHPDVESLLAWASAEGVRLEPGQAGELLLIV
jgi:cytoplasmic iron level regulating protein YaaA (DUF328/UPF0246 family)